MKRIKIELSEEEDAILYYEKTMRKLFDTAQVIRTQNKARQQIAVGLICLMISVQV